MMYYWFAILDNVKFTLEVICGFGFLGLVGTLIGNFISFTDDWTEETIKPLRIWTKWYCVIYSIFLLLMTFIPSQKQMAFIIAAPYIVENQDLKDASANTAEIIKMGTEYLKETLKTKGFGND